MILSSKDSINYNRILEQCDYKVYNAHCQDIIDSFSTLRYELNPDICKNKNYKDLYGRKLKDKNIMQFFYYLSNTLVCISHDIMYAINKIIDSNDYTKEEKSMNVHNIMIKSVIYIKNALSSLRSGTFWIDLLNMKNETEKKFENHFKQIKHSVLVFELYIQDIIKRLDKHKNDTNKIKELMEKIKQYENFKIFKENLQEEINIDTKLSMIEQYNNIKKHTKFVDCSQLDKNGKINEELVKQISNININVAKDVILNVLDNIEDKIYEICYHFIRCEEDNQDLNEYIIKNIFINSDIYRKYHTFLNKYLSEIKIPSDKLINNENLCRELYYEKYAKILLDYISDIIKSI